MNCRDLKIFVAGLTLLGGVTLQSTGAQAQQDGKISLPVFLDQVRGDNQGFKSSAEAQRGAELKAFEATLLTKPVLFGLAQLSENRAESGNAMQGDEVRATTYRLGVRQSFTFGLDAKLTYSLAHTVMPGANPGVLQPDVYTAGPVLDFTQALGRNGFGRELRAGQQAGLAAAEMTRFTESYRQKQTLAEAETVYWRLALAREAVKATRDTVGRAERLRARYQERLQSNLGDRSEFLQADAAYLGRSLELQAALDEERAATRAFNTMRGSDSDQVGEQLDPIDGKMLEGLQMPERAPYRDDVKAAEKLKAVADANAQASVEKNRPVINLIGQLGLNGRDPQSNEAISESTSGDHPNYMVGIQLEIPLDVGVLSKNREGYRAEAAAADLSFQRKVFEQERSWKDLTNQFKESLERYKLANQIENAQREKLDYERSRHSRGLTTIFQVLQFEQDFANSQLSRIRSQTDVLKIYAQLKTFGGDK